jgi:hypothetical protein
LRWATDSVEALSKAPPDIPAGFHNRVRANWRTILAIAEQAGADWKKKAHKAALEIEKVAAAAEPGLAVRLLSDIRDVFILLKADRVTTKTLIAELTTEEEGPWLSYGKGGKPITDRQLGKLLSDFRRGYGIKSRSIRVEGTAATPKGYVRADFEDDFSSYLPPVAAKTASATPQQMSVFNDLEGNACATDGHDVARHNESNPLVDNNCCGVPNESPVSAATHESVRVEGDFGADLGAVPLPGEECSCRQCEATPDGTEQPYEIGGERRWLHPECYAYLTRAKNEAVRW